MRTVRLTVAVAHYDEESYEVFKELFDPVISARHGGYDHVSNKQPTNMDISKLSDTDIDPQVRRERSAEKEMIRSIFWMEY